MKRIKQLILMLEVTTTMAFIVLAFVLGSVAGHQSAKQDMYEAPCKTYDGGAK